MDEATTSMEAETAAIAGSNGAQSCETGTRSRLCAVVSHARKSCTWPDSRALRDSIIRLAIYYGALPLCTQQAIRSSPATYTSKAR